MSSPAGSGISDTASIIEDPSNPDWVNLPNDILAFIVTMLGTLSDVCHFGAVCRSWYRATLVDRPNRIKVENNQRPILSVPILSKTRGGGSWLNARKGTPHEIVVDIDRDMRTCGSSHGWLIRMDVISTWFTFINPSSGVDIHLPHLMKDAMDLEYNGGGDHDDNAGVGAGAGAGDLEYNGGGDDDDNAGDGAGAGALNDYERFFITKAVLSADPLFHLDDFTMAVIFGNICRMALYASRTNSWTFLDHQSKGFHDVIFYKGRFYFVDIDSSVYSCDIDDPVLVQVIGPPPEQPEIGYRNYLVESPGGNLLQVWRLLFEDEEAPTRPFVTKGFQIFKLVNQEGQSEMVWEAVKRLEGVALYLGDNHGISVESADYPGCVVENSVYFTTECCDMSKTGWREPCLPFDTGRYSLTGDTIFWNGICKEQKKWPPPIWVIPTLPEEGLDI